MRAVRLMIGAAAAAAMAPLVACSSNIPVETPEHNRQTELRREQDCRDTAWKAAHLGLWYNVCRPDQAE